MAKPEGLFDFSNSTIAHQLEVIRSERMTSFIAEKTKGLMRPINDSWQPYDLLPDRSKPGWAEAERVIMDQAGNLSRELVLATVFHLVTEENLPGYMRALNMFMTDFSGTDQTPHAVYSRIWVAQEKKHGEAFHDWAHLSGRVNMAELDRVVGHQIANGFNMGTKNLYECFVYTSDQERKTKKVHGKTGREARKQGVETLSLICSTVTGDEAVHERFYVDLFGQIMEEDPQGALIALRDMMENGGPIMPGLLIDDGEMGSTAKRPNMFLQFGRVDQQLGVFDFYSDSADDLGYFMNEWRVLARSVSGEAARAQENLVKIHAELLRKAEKRTDRAKQMPNLSVFDRLVPAT